MQANNINKEIDDLINDFQAKNNLSSAILCGLIAGKLIGEMVDLSEENFDFLLQGIKLIFLDYKRLKNASE